MAFNNPLPNVLVLGHSFVARLWNDIRFNHDPSHLHHNFGLAQATVRFLGFRSGVIQTLIEDVHDRLRQEMLQHSPSLVILQIGGNDIDRPDFDIEGYVRDVLYLIDLLQHHYLVLSVVVCEIFPRCSTRHIPCHEYQEIKDRITLDLNSELSHTSNACLWRHREGLMTRDEYSLVDGVHLNQAGTRRFYRSLRGIVMQFFPL